MDVKTEREKRGLSQQDLADKTGIPKDRIAKWEQRNAQPKADDFIILNQFFMDNVPREINSVEDKTLPYIKRRQSQKSTAQPYLIPFVGRKAQAGYVKSYDQIQYLDTLEKYSLPPGVDPRGAEWMYFEVQGDSMEEAFHNGDIILASMVPQVDYNEIRNFYVYVIVTEDRLLIKRLYRKSPKKWVMISDNEKQYAQEYLNVEDIRQLWVYRKTWHTNAKPPKQFEIKI